MLASTGRGRGWRSPVRWFERGRLQSVLQVVLAAALVALTACQAPSPAQSVSAAAPSQPGIPGPGLKVLAAETFLADMAQNVAGQRLKVESLLPVGADPHSFEPTPGDLLRVSQSDVLIVNGAGFEGFLDRLLSNAGGQRRLIEASAGLRSRTAREGEVAEMSDSDLVDAICTAAGEEQPQAVEAAGQAGAANALPAEAGLFQVTLARQSDGTYGGSLRYSTDEGGDFQLATDGGRAALSAGSGAPGRSKSLKLPWGCQGLSAVDIVPLQRGIEYTLTLSGFARPQAVLLIGPAGGQHHHDGDPHFWLDPTKAVKYVENIRDGLSQADPAGASQYAANAEDYVGRLHDLDAWITDQVQTIPPEQRLLITNHESFGYYADRYGFRVVGTVVPSVSTDASPSAQQLARLIDRIRATHATAIFLETGTNPQLAQQVAEDTGVKVVTDLYTHSTTGPGGPAPTYIAMMKHDTQAIVQALK